MAKFILTNVPLLAQTRALSCWHTCADMIARSKGRHPLQVESSRTGQRLRPEREAVQLYFKSPRLARVDHCVPANELTYLRVGDPEENQWLGLGQANPQFTARANRQFTDRVLDQLGLVLIDDTQWQRWTSHLFEANLSIYGALWAAGRHFTNNLHCVVVIGIDGDEVVLHDPWKPERRRQPVEQFLNATTGLAYMR